MKIADALKITHNFLNESFNYTGDLYRFTSYAEANNIIIKSLFRMSNNIKDSKSFKKTSDIPNSIIDNKIKYKYYKSFTRNISGTLFNSFVDSNNISFALNEPKEYKKLILIKFNTKELNKIKSLTDSTSIQISGIDIEEEGGDYRYEAEERYYSNERVLSVKPSIIKDIFIFVQDIDKTTLRYIRKYRLSGINVSILPNPNYAKVDTFMAPTSLNKISDYFRSLSKADFYKILKNLTGKLHVPKGNYGASKFMRHPGPFISSSRSVSEYISNIDTLVY